MDAETATNPAIDPWGVEEALPPRAWWPALVVESAWIEHTPFAAWLIGAAQPSTVVELGTFRGASFMAFCQAARRLPNPPRCFAVDTWQGDEHAGIYDGGSMFADVAAAVAADYADIATLLRMRFEEALGRFEDGSIDVLHIDGFHTYEAVAEDFRTWLPKMSRRGIVLFHDTEVRERGFGVWQLWAEASADRPAFSFLHGHGLGVLAVGTEIPPGVAPLFAARGDAAAEARIRTLFATRGAAVAARYQAMATPPAPRARDGSPPAPEDRPTRQAELLAGATPASRILEIGPSHAPIAPRSAGWDTTVVDHADRAGLVAKYANDKTVDTSRIEDVDFVWTGGTLDSLIPADRHGSYDLLIASHVVEHFPDPVGVLLSAQRLLRPDTGVVSLAVPDKRTCFDFFRPPSTTGKMLAAHRDGRVRHLGADVFDTAAYASALNGATGWGWVPTADVRPYHRLAEAHAAFRAAGEAPDAPYTDSHAWVFTPSSFELIILELGELGIIDWRVERVVVQAGVEFTVHLHRGRRVFPSSEAFEAYRLDLLRDMMRDLHAQTSLLFVPTAPVEPPAGPAKTLVRRMLPFSVRQKIARLRGRVP